MHDEYNCILSLVENSIEPYSFYGVLAALFVSAIVNAVMITYACMRFVAVIILVQNALLAQSDDSLTYIVNIHYSVSF